MSVGKVINKGVKLWLSCPQCAVCPTSHTRVLMPNTGQALGGATGSGRATAPRAESLMSPHPREPFASSLRRPLTQPGEEQVDGHLLCPRPGLVLVQFCRGPGLDRGGPDTDYATDNRSSPKGGTTPSSNRQPETLA